MTSARTVADQATHDTATRRVANWYMPGLSDGLGDRLLMFDNSNAAPLELLRFRREFSENLAFEDALRARARELEDFAHPAIATVRAIERLSAGEGLSLVSNHTPGRRVSELLREARSPVLAMKLVRQLTPVLAKLHQQGSHVAHGTLTSERIIVTPEGHLVIVEHVVGAAIEALGLPARRWQSELGLVVRPSSGRVRLDGREDLFQLAFVALSIMVGRRLDPADYPENCATLLEECARSAPHGSPAARELQPWLERALQLGGRAFDSAEDAYGALEEWKEGRGMLPDLPRRALRAVEIPTDPAIAASAEMAPLNDAGFLTEELAGIRPLPSEHPVAVVPELVGRDAGLSADASAPTVAPVWTPRADSPRKTNVQRARPSVAVIGLALLSGAEALVIAGLILTRSTGVSLVQGRDLATVNAHANPNGTLAGLAPPTAGSGSREASAPPVAAVSPVVPPAAAPASHLDVTSDPPGARVTVDRTARGVTPLTVPVEAGQHTVVVSDGTTSVTQTVSVTANASATVAAALARPAEAGWLSITVPIDLQVIENGTLVGTSSVPRIMIPAGHHDLHLVNTAVGFDTTLSINVVAGKTVSATIPIPNGSLSLNALPWANVLVDGRAAGATPVANMDVPIGSHEIIWRNPSLGERRQTVVVTAKTPVRVVVDFNK